MNDIRLRTFSPTSRLQQMTAAIADFRWRFRRKHIVRAWRYARRTLTTDDAQIITLDCQDACGWHPLIVLTVEDTMQHAYEEFEEHPELPRLITEACARVSTKWDDFGDTLSEARRWAIELAESYAAQEGIELARRADEPDSTSG
ncbi:MAG: hypothetical protein ACOY5F_18690 [Pseudomonadota bacterium]